jgi:hypothetical protein
MAFQLHCQGKRGSTTGNRSENSGLSVQTLCILEDAAKTCRVVCTSRPDSRRARSQISNSRSRMVVQLILGLMLAGWVAFALSARGKQTRSSATIDTSVKPSAEPNNTEIPTGKEDFRFLLAILAGVALGVGAAALQKMIELAALTPEFFLLVLFWITSFAAVTVVYLAVKYGAFFMGQRIDATETILLMVVAVTECAMFASVALGPGPNLALRWFLSLSAFGLFAGSMVAVVSRKLRPRLQEQIDNKLRHYIESLPVDIIMPFVTFLSAAIYISINPHPSVASAMVAGTISLLFILAGIVKQRNTRRQIFA